VSDVNLTKQAIEAASDAPLSIVIVGIGNADFSAMQFLDDFQKRGQHKRDICQFVEFQKYGHDRRALTRETLDEIPDQLVDFFFSKGIMPLPPISGSQISLVASEPDEADMDLNLNFGEDGEISLENYNGAVFDDTQYGTASNFQATAPYQPSYHPPAAAPPAPYQPNQQQQPTHIPYGGVHAPVPAYSKPQQQRLFHVQAPPGAYAGMQVQVQNPVNGQMLMVAIPPGVAPGGTFAVQY